MAIGWFNEMVFHFQKELERRYGIKKSTHNLGPIENTSQSQDPGRKGRAKKAKNIHSCRNHDNSSYTNVDNLPDSDDDSEEPLFFVTDSNGDIFSSKNWETEVENYLCYLSELERYCSFMSQVKDGFSGWSFDLFKKTNKTGGSNQTEESFSRRVLDIGFGREFDLDFKYDDNPQVKDYTNFDEIEIFDPRFNRYNENPSGNSENQNENQSDDSENPSGNSENQNENQSGESNPNAWMGELWVMCEDCAHLNFKKFFLDKLNICEECGSHLAMNSSERIEVFVDPGTWVPMHEDMLSLDFLACLWEEGEYQEEENKEQEENKEVDKEENKQEESELVEEGPLYRLYKKRGAYKYKVVFPYKQKEVEKEENKQQEGEYQEEEGFELAEAYGFVEKGPLYELYQDGESTYKINKVEIEYHKEENKEVDKEENKQEKSELVREGPLYILYKYKGDKEENKQQEQEYELLRGDPFDRYDIYKTKINGVEVEFPYKVEVGENTEQEENKEVDKEENNKEEENKEVDKEENNKEGENKEVDKEENKQEEEKDEPYDDRLDRYERDTGLSEAIQTGVGQINGFPVAMGFMDFRFIGGSMGSVVGEKITRLIEYATNQFLPLIIVCASGGARMQEGSLSLMQMGKIACALYDYQSINKLFFVSVLTSPTTGGVTASFGMLGDIIIAEPNATIAFAGKRVIEETLKIEVPEGIQETEFLFEQGAFDLILPRTLFKKVLIEIFRFQDLESLNTNLMKYSIR
uniref:acetyl-CoA carboxylase beta subunit n=1 Tax=Lantana camara TaxID=126435 RepID=UPI001FA7DC35|nr:acetyl-CoA carboxylase beta subunit [Lantana camara]UNB14615.1 acetyl-CoA carboxylase beta subunit [Lantana camara]WDS80572.1 acetyl-CoA carboxylase beta subunit [Lantana camara]